MKVLLIGCMKNKKYILIAIIFLALVIRVYRIDSVPAAVNWDEAAVGYNAYTIANWGKDEWGKTLPLVFKSFEDYKHPVHIYMTALFVRVLGLNDFSVRIPSAIFGVLNVYLIYLVGKRLFNSEWMGIIASLFLALSPYNIHFSRFNHELNFAVFFFLLAIYLFCKAIQEKETLHILSQC